MLVWKIITFLVFSISIAFVENRQNPWQNYFTLFLVIFCLTIIPKLEMIFHGRKKCKVKVKSLKLKPISSV
jgi:hypothetical protein